MFKNYFLFGILVDFHCNVPRTIFRCLQKIGIRCSIKDKSDVCPRTPLYR